MMIIDIIKSPEEQRADWWKEQVKNLAIIGAALYIGCYLFCNNEKKAKA